MDNYYYNIATDGILTEKELSIYLMSQYGFQSNFDLTNEDDYYWVKIPLTLSHELFITYFETRDLDFLQRYNSLQKRFH